MSVEREVLQILDSVLGLQGRSARFGRDTPLLGALPELDSMAVLAVLTTLEERFGLSIHDDELDGSVFASVGALCDFVSARCAG